MDTRGDSERWPWKTIQKAADTLIAGESVLIDFDGAYRPQDSDHDGITAFDIGAYEFGAWRAYLPIMLKEN